MSDFKVGDKVRCEITGVCGVVTAVGDQSVLILVDGREHCWSKQFFRSVAEPLPTPPEGREVEPEKRVPKSGGGSVLLPGVPVNSHYGHLVLNLRDYFAAHAPPVPDWFKSEFESREYQKARAKDTYAMRGMAECMAEWPWYFADAMLKAREAK